MKGIGGIWLHRMIITNERNMVDRMKRRSKRKRNIVGVVAYC